MKRSTVYFDDVCVLCSRSVRFINKNDPRGRFQFASLKSDHFKRAVMELKNTTDNFPDSLVLVQKDKMYTRSGAALRIAARLRFPWPLFTIFFLFPRFLRNSLYDFIARNRYQWFGKRKSCFVPQKGAIEIVDS